MQEGLLCRWFVKYPISRLIRRRDFVQLALQAVADKKSDGKSDRERDKNRNRFYDLSLMLL